MVRVFPDHETLSSAAADFIADLGLGAVEERGRFELVLSGGGTPRRTYEFLAVATGQDHGFWQQTHIYWGDERWVPHDDPTSNCRMARESLLDPARVPSASVHPIPTGAQDPDADACAYEEVFPETPDLLLLGMGADGHTASLFPGSAAMDETERRFLAVEAPVEPRQRITATPLTIFSMKKILVLVTGAKKAEALERVHAEVGSTNETPARLVAGADWYVDRPAAERVLRLGISGRARLDIEAAT